MIKKKILIAFGTRPEAIKLIPIIKKLEKNDAFDTKICITAQHREMLDNVLHEFDIKADFDLSIMKKGQTLSYITQAILEKMDDVFLEFTPDMILVHGDTTTAFAVSLSAFYKEIPVGHIEAGLRSQNLRSPFPEEFNRRSISLMSHLHFAPTERAMQNLILEGIPEENIFVVGNTVIDTLLYESSYKALENETQGYKYIIFTAHRREHTNDEINNIFKAIKNIATAYPDIKIIYPVHKTPRFFETAHKNLDNIPNIQLCEPMNVKKFHALMRKCYFLITDSGGIQEEASFLGKPVLLLRDNTERPEAKENGSCKIIGSNEENIFKEASLLINDIKEYEMMSQKCFSFGDGHASEKIIEILTNVDIYKSSFS